MKIENKKKVWKFILKRGDELTDSLPSHPNHPKGRNPYAHICSLIKNEFGCSYKEISDDRFIEVLEFIDNIAK